jgi:hypothetical protein
MKTLLLAEVSEQNFFKVRKSQIGLGSFCNRKSTHFLGVSVRKPQNPQIFRVNPQIPKPQISTKYCTTPSRNSPKSRLLNMILYFVQI